MKKNFQLRLQAMSDGDYELPPMEFEFIDTTVNSKAEPENEQEASQQFSLFADDPYGQAETSIVDEVQIDRSRPLSYYIADYSGKDLSQFEQAAIEYDQIFHLVDNRWKNRQPIDIDEYNKSISLKKKRPGLKQRKNRRLAKEKVLQRKKSIKNAKLAELKKIHQKKKRGGKKNKKGAAKQATQVKESVYRTE